MRQAQGSRQTPGNPHSKTPGENGAPTSANANGARSARTTARTETPGTTSAMTRPDPVRITGAKTVSLVSAMKTGALLQRGSVERQGSNTQGATVRLDQQRKQPRRGRQRVLLLPR